MSKINKNSINYGLKMLTILAFGLIFIPINTTKAAYGTNIGDYYSTYQPVVNNPKPFINSINPSYGDMGSGSKTITITGDNFIPGSIGKVNGSNRTTTFIDHAHLLMQLSANDMYRNDSFFITVFNGAPGGGYSDATLFTLNNPVGVSGNTNGTNNNSYNSNNYSNTSTNSTTSSSNTNTSNNSTGSRYGNLASSVILGSSTGFLPSGLVQWVLLAIVILVIIILARKVFHAEENYHATPLKHA